MSFVPYNTEQLSEPTTRVLLANSLTFTIGDTLAIVYSANKITATNAAASVGGLNVQIFGVIAGFEDNFGGTLPVGYSSTNANQKSVATATLGTVYARCYLPEQDMAFVADLSGVSGTTAGSDQPYVYFNHSTATVATVDETTVTRTLSSANQIYSLGVNPQNSKQIICKIICSDFNNLNAT